MMYPGDGRQPVLWRALAGGPGAANGGLMRALEPISSHRSPPGEPGLAARHPRAARLLLALALLGGACAPAAGSAPAGGAAAPPAPPTAGSGGAAPGPPRSPPPPALPAPRGVPPGGV